MLLSILIVWYQPGIADYTVSMNLGFSTLNMFGIADDNMIIRASEVSRHFCLFPFFRKTWTDPKPGIIPLHTQDPLIQPHHAPRGSPCSPGLIGFPVISRVRRIAVGKYIRFCPGLLRRVLFAVRHNFFQRFQRLFPSGRTAVHEDLKASSMTVHSAVLKKSRQHP